MLIRMFGVFGAMLSYGYFSQGLSYIRPTVIALVRQANGAFIWRYAFMVLDFSFGLSLLIAAFGLLIVKEWARKMWLVVTTALVFVHLAVLLLHEVLDLRVTPFYLAWTWMVALSTALVWWYFNKPLVRARFLGKQPNIETESASPAE
jgi:hypothetical protein